MGESDRQFKGFLRLLISALREVNEEENAEKRKVKLESVIKDLQSTLEG